MLYCSWQKYEENIHISSGIANYFSCQRRVKNQNPQAPLFPVCLLLVTAGDGVLAWKASYWPYYILIKSKLFSGLEQRFFCSEKKKKTTFAGYFWLWSQRHCRSSVLTGNGAACGRPLSGVLRGKEGTSRLELQQNSLKPWCSPQHSQPAIRIASE